VRATGDVELRDVTFCHERDRPVLAGLSFEIPVGEKVAVVGPSGAGTRFGLGPVVVIELLEDLLGRPVVLEDLKHKPGRRSTWRAVGSRQRAIVKRYASDRAPAVAARVSALAAGPAEPVVPKVLAFDADLHLIVLSEVPGVPFGDAVLAGDVGACAQVGVTLAHWHLAWRGAAPVGFRAHTAGRELDILGAQADLAPAELGEAVRTVAPTLGGDWECSTVVHRDLYEEQVLLGAQVGLIDLDDAALGPPELDLGNLLAHLELLGVRSGTNLALAGDALLHGYVGVAPLDPALLDRMRRLSLLRLACIHREPLLVSMATTRADPPAPPLNRPGFRGGSTPWK